MPEGGAEFRPAVDAAELQASATIEERTRAAFNEGTSDYWARFGATGHEGEYTLHVRGYDINNMLPNGFDQPLKTALGDTFDVMNRGSRIEIRYKGDENGVGRGEPCDEVVEPVLEQIFNPREADA
jgi:hypothetical protein